MSIQTGYYEFWYEYTQGGVSKSGSFVAPLVVTDTPPSAGTLSQLVDDGVLTSRGSQWLERMPNLSGLFIERKWVANAGYSNVPNPGNLANTLSLLGINCSFGSVLPTFGTPRHIKIWMDAAKTKQIVNDDYTIGTGSVSNCTYFAELIQGSTAGGVYINTPVFYAPTSLSQVKFTYIYAVGNQAYVGNSWYSVDSDMYEYFTQVEPVIINTDPYKEGGTSTTKGGTGNFDGTSDPIDIPSLPTLSAVDTGFITLFNPSLSQLQALATYMWDGSLFDLNTWQKLFADPMDAILGLSIVPVAVPGGATATVKVGNISTGVSMTKATSQYVEVDCGTINVNEYWGAYLDYDPYTKAEIYLPYCGIHPLKTDDIMGKAVTVKYHVDILSGACVAYVKCGISVLYTFMGQCAASVPVSGTDFTTMINGIISSAVSIGSMVATGGASAPMALANVASNAVNSFKPEVEKSGSLSGAGGLLGIQTPYLILTIPSQVLPENQNAFIGYPSYITKKLSALSGYTEVESIHMDKFEQATQDEMEEIEKLLKEGVIL